MPFLEINRIHHTHIIADKQALAIGYRGGIDTALQGLVPLAFHVGVLLVDSEVGAQLLVGWSILLLAKRQTEPMSGFFADTLLVEADAIGHRDDRIPIHAIIIAQVRAVEHIGYTVAVE